MAILGDFHVIFFLELYNLVAAVIRLRHEVEEDHPQGDEELSADIAWQISGFVRGWKSRLFCSSYMYIFSGKKN